MREKKPLSSLQELTQLLLIEYHDMSIKCLWPGYLMNIYMEEAYCLNINGYTVSSTV